MRPEAEVTWQILDKAGLNNLAPTKAICFGSLQTILKTNAANSMRQMIAIGEVAAKVELSEAGFMETTAIFVTVRSSKVGSAHRLRGAEKPDGGAKTAGFAAERPPSGEQ